MHNKPSILIAERVSRRGFDAVANYVDSVVEEQFIPANAFYGTTEDPAHQLLYSSSLPVWSFAVGTTVRSVAAYWDRKTPLVYGKIIYRPYFLIETDSPGSFVVYISRCDISLLTPNTSPPEVNGLVVTTDMVGKVAYCDMIEELRVDPSVLGCGLGLRVEPSGKTSYEGTAHLIGVRVLYVASKNEVR